jgi:hypothetical protein
VVTGPGGSQILAVDPAGNLVELFQPAQQAGARDRAAGERSSSSAHPSHAGL